ncbi:MAG: hypothetical protein ABS58_05870 [Mesorhizobium sp. SCN 65-20]|nr:MAG: hypothetical protein ABS58_05870 [Mesorhizobium sp. SCN 65-20]
MVQSILFFVLGFLTAGFFVLLIAPAVLRRSVTMTRQRVEAKLPMTLEEIRAEKDALRAEHAMALRKVEVQLKSAQEKVLNQAVEISRNREALKGLTVVQQPTAAVVAPPSPGPGQLGKEITKRDEQIKRLSGQLVEAERVLEERAREIRSLGEMLEEASLASSNRQIELVSRESEMGKLSDDMRTQRKDVEKRMRDLETDNKAVRAALKAETKRAVELDKKLERMVAALSDSDEKLEARDEELARLREQLSKLPDAAATSANGGAHDDGASAERQRLETRLTKLTRENKRLKGELAASGGAETPAATQDALLREQMHELAAEVVALTARLEGPDSPIARVLSAEVNGHAPAAEPGVISLADRVRALQKTLPAE